MATLSLRRSSQVQKLLPVLAMSSPHSTSIRQARFSTFQWKVSRKPIGTTARHPFWSIDRNDFIDAGELRVGEKLMGANGKVLRVENITERNQLEKVYNIEVHGEHVYRVSSKGILVHNADHSGRWRFLPARWQNEYVIKNGILKKLMKCFRLKSLRISEIALKRLQEKKVKKSSIVPLGQQIKLKIQPKEQVQIPMTRLML